MKKLLYLLIPVLFFALASCEKIPDGQGVLNVKMPDVSASGSTINVYPWGEKTAPPVASQLVLSQKDFTASFTLNVGNYVVTCDGMQDEAVQIKEGEEVEVVLRAVEKVRITGF